LVYGRLPSEAETQLGLRFLSGGEQPAASDPANTKATPKLSKWEQYAQILLSGNECMYVD
jgi:hypothetical protein